MSFVFDRHDLNVLINEIYCTFQLMMPEGVELRMRVPEIPVVVAVDPYRLKQVLSNFINNAIKFTTSGYIEVGYYFCTKGDCLHIYVEDTGIGIPEEKQKQVFDRFCKLDEFAQGTGLGLSICKAIADVCGGGVGFKSEYGQGSVFWAILPCSVSVTGDKGEKDNKQESVIEDWTEREVLTDVKSMNRKLILVAEDIQSNYLLISASLQKDYDLIRAVNGKEAVEIVRTVPGIDLVLMDMKMPETDGMTATREIRTFNKKLPIIALTAYAFDTDKQAALAAGCNDYLVKPIDKVKLRAVLQKYG